MPFVRMQEELAYEFRLTRMLRRLLRSILDGDTAQNMIVPRKDLCCLDYAFSGPCFLTCCDYIRNSLDFEHRFQERSTFFTIFVPWYCIVAFLFSPRIVHVSTFPWTAVSGAVWKRIVRLWNQLLSALRTTPAGCSKVPSGRLISRFTGVSLLSVLRCSSSGLLPRKYSVFFALVIAVRE